MPEIKQVSNEAELMQILELQRINLRGTQTAEIEKEQGFVTLVYTMEMMRAMHALTPSIIARHNSKLAGYALAVSREASSHVPDMAHLFSLVDTLSYHGQPIKDQAFYLMGQICVDSPYRGSGVFDGLYQGHREAYSDKYDFIITDVATRNTRSMRAHERIGFQTIHTYRDQLDEWATVLWDWR